MLWVKTAETVWCPSKAIVTAPWGQPAPRKQNIVYSWQKICVQEAVEIKRKVNYKRKTELHR